LKLHSYKPFSDIWKFYGDFVNPAFKSIWPDDEYVYIRRTSSCCKRS